MSEYGRFGVRINRNFWIGKKTAIEGQIRTCYKKINRITFSISAGKTYIFT